MLLSVYSIYDFSTQEYYHRSKIWPDLQKNIQVEHVVLVHNFSISTEFSQAVNRTLQSESECLALCRSSYRNTAWRRGLCYTPSLRIFDLTCLLAEHSFYN